MESHMFENIDRSAPAPGGGTLPLGTETMTAPGAAREVLQGQSRIRTPAWPRWAWGRLGL